MKHVDAVVVGAGFGGLYMLHKLREAGLSATTSVTTSPSPATDDQPPTGDGPHRPSLRVGTRVFRVPTPGLALDGGEC